MVDFLKIAFLILVFQRTAIPTTILIGGLFNPNDQEIANAFNNAVKRVNADPTILTGSHLKAFSEIVHPDSCFQATKKVCGLLRKGVTAIFGPQDPDIAGVVQGVCDTFSIPHIETRWDHQLRPYSSHINFYPHSTTIAKILAAFIKEWGLNDYTILYDDDQALINLEEVIKSHNSAQSPLNIKRLTGRGKLKKVLKNVLDPLVNHIIVHCSGNKILPIVNLAKELGMLRERDVFIFISLDVNVLDVKDVLSDSVFIYTIRMNHDGAREMRFLNVSEPNQTLYLKNENFSYDNRINPENTTDENYPPVSLEAVLMYDAVHLFAKAVDKIILEKTFHLSNISCDRLEDIWVHGREIIYQMKTIQMKGLTGNIKFDKNGIRTGFEIDVMEVGQNKLSKIGTMSNNGIGFLRSNISKESMDRVAMKPLFFRVVTILSVPFCMKKQNESKKLEGFAIDLIELLAMDVGFAYELLLSSDGKYGSFNTASMSWNGMVLDLVTGRADIAAADFTINYERGEVIEYTLPFMTLGTAILFQGRDDNTPGLFSFLTPVSLTVWIYVVISYFCVSVALFLVARFSPYETHFGRRYKIKASKTVQEFTLVNSMWFSFGSLMHQGLDALPRAGSTRTIVSVWWAFSLLLVSFYTANLASFLTLKDVQHPVESIEELGMQNNIKYGIVGSSATETLFKESSSLVYRKMYKKVSSNLEDNVKSNKEGAQRVEEENGKYAFITDSTFIEYIKMVECNMVQIGKTLDYTGFGLGLRLNSDASRMRLLLSSKILQYQEEGTISELKKKWWEEKRYDTLCSEWQKNKKNKRVEERQPLDLTHLGGLFLVLVSGMIIAIALACFDLLKMSKSKAKIKKIPLLEQAQHDLHESIILNPRRAKTIVAQRAQNTGG